MYKCLTGYCNFSSGAMRNNYVQINVSCRAGLRGLWWCFSKFQLCSSAAVRAGGQSGESGDFLKSRSGLTDSDLLTVKYESTRDAGVCHRGSWPLSKQAQIQGIALFIFVLRKPKTTAEAADWQQRWNVVRGRELLTTSLCVKNIRVVKFKRPAKKNAQKKYILIKWRF